MQREAIVLQNTYLCSDSTQSFIEKPEDSENQVKQQMKQLSKSVGKNKSLSVVVSVIAIVLVSVFMISFTIYLINKFYNKGGRISPLYHVNRDESFSKFQQYKTNFNKFYPDVESENQRYQIFHSNYEYIHLINNNIEDVLEYTLKINQFADLSSNQFRQKYTGLIVPTEMKGFLGQKQEYAIEQQPKTIPDKQDLSQFCLPARNQHTCGSCWAFASTGAIQCENSRTYDVRQQLSPQQLIDCSFDYKNAGCVGGLMQYAYDYIIDNNITIQEKYPYTNSEHFCRFRGGKYSIKSYKKVSPFNIDAHLTAFSQHFVTVAINASQEMRFYDSGVLSEQAICGPDVNHGVIVTGYEIIYKNGEKCMRLKMKNSWGQDYGQNGYFYGDVCNRWCGMLAMSTYVIV